MNNEIDIQYRMLASRYLSLQNEYTFWREEMAGCVSRKEYESRCAECEANATLLKECEKRLAESEARAAGAVEKLEAANVRIGDLEKLLNDALQENDRLKRKEFEPSSEIMDDDDVEAPQTNLEALACVHGLKLAAKEIFKGESNTTGIPQRIYPGCGNSHKGVPSARHDRGNKGIPLHPQRRDKADSEMPRQEDRGDGVSHRVRAWYPLAIGKPFADALR